MPNEIVKSKKSRFEPFPIYPAHIVSEQQTIESLSKAAKLMGIPQLTREHADDIRATIGQATTDILYATIFDDSTVRRAQTMLGDSTLFPYAPALLADYGKITGSIVDNPEYVSEIPVLLGTNIEETYRATALFRIIMEFIEDPSIAGARAYTDSYVAVLYGAPHSQVRDYTGKKGQARRIFHSILGYVPTAAETLSLFMNPSVKRQIESDQMLRALAVKSGLLAYMIGASTEAYTELQSSIEASANQEFHKPLQKIDRVAGQYHYTKEGKQMTIDDDVREVEADSRYYTEALNSGLLTPEQQGVNAHKLEEVELARLALISKRTELLVDLQTAVSQVIAIKHHLRAQTGMQQTTAEMNADLRRVLLQDHLTFHTVIAHSFDALHQLVAAENQVRRRQVLEKYGQSMRDARRSIDDAVKGILAKGEGNVEEALDGDDLTDDEKALAKIIETRKPKPIIGE